MPDTDTQQPLFGAPATSPASLANRRALALELQKQGLSTDPIRSPWQGVGRIFQAAMGGYEGYQSDKKEQEARAKLLADVLSARNSGDSAKTLGAALNPFTPDRVGDTMAEKAFPRNVDTGMTVQPQSQITGAPAAQSLPKQIVTGQSAEGVSGPTVVTPQNVPPGAMATPPIGGVSPPAPRPPQPQAGMLPAPPVITVGRGATWDGLGANYHISGQDLALANGLDPTRPPPPGTRITIPPRAAPPGAQPQAAAPQPGAPPQAAAPPQPGMPPGVGAMGNNNGALLAPQGLDALAAKGRQFIAQRQQQETQLEGIKQDVQAGNAAPGQLQALNIIEDIARTTPMITGATAEPLLKLRQTINGLAGGQDILGSTAPQEVYKKMNTYLATEVAKAMSSRGASNFDFSTQMGNMPGNLMNSAQGTLMLASILKQIYRQNLQLGNEASTTQNFGGWTNRRTQFYDQNPIINPLDNKPMGTSRDTPQQQGTIDRQGYTILDGKRYRKQGNDWVEVQ